MRRIPRWQAALLVTVFAAATVTALAMVPRSLALPQPEAHVSFMPAIPPPPPVSGPEGPQQILVQIFRARPLTAGGGVEVTTIFRGPSFTVLADSVGVIGSEDALRERVRDLFSLEQVDSIGSSLVDLPGGSALLDDGGRPLEVRLSGQPVGDRALRLVVAASLDGTGTVSTSVIARQGKTIVLAGQPSATEPHVRFLCLTPI
jgi:hypothetical protein